VRPLAGGLLAALLGAAPCFADLSEAGAQAGILSRSFALQAGHTILRRSVPPARPTLLGPQRPVAPRGVPHRQTSKDSGSYRGLVEQYASQHGVDPDLVSAVIEVESGGNPRAVSHKGAAGLMQIMPETARELGLRNAFDPEANIASGTQYLRQLLDRYGSPEVALWAYNAGPKAVDLGHMPAETRQYVPRVLKARQRLSRTSED
jgi:soluble lytic murein transglycosylase-like protein